MTHAKWERKVSKKLHTISLILCVHAWDMREREGLPWPAPVKPICVCIYRSDQTAFSAQSFGDLSHGPLLTCTRRRGALRGSSSLSSRACTARRLGRQDLGGYEWIVAGGGGSERISVSKRRRRPCRPTVHVSLPVDFARHLVVSCTWYRRNACLFSGRRSGKINVLNYDYRWWSFRIYENQCKIASFSNF